MQDCHELKQHKGDNNTDQMPQTFSKNRKEMKQKTIFQQFHGCKKLRHAPFY
jgi:hypothetical protein